MKTNPGDAKWEQVALGDVCEFRRGLTYKKSDEVPFSKNVILRANNITAETGEINFNEMRFINDEIDIPQSKKIIPGCLLVCTASGSKKHLGKIGIVDTGSNYAFGGFMGILVPAERVLSKYLFYVTRSDIYRDFIDALSDGMNINNLKWSQLSQFRIPLPPLAEQKRIVAVLDEAFAAIATATANTEKNLANAQELFDSALHRVFQPTQPAEDSVSDVTARTVKIMDVVEPLTTTDPRKQPEESFEYIDVSSVSRITHSIRTTSPTLGCDAPSRAKRLVRAGDVLFATIRPTLQRIAIVPAHLDQAICSTGYFVLRPKPDVNSRFLFYYLFSQPFSDEMALLQRGASYPAVSDRDVKEHLIHLPPLPEQKRIATFLDKLSAEKQTLVDIYETKMRTLGELKQSMLHQAFTGELTKQMNTENKTQTANDLIAELCNKYGNGNLIFRGTTKIFSGDPKGVNSSLYRWVYGRNAITENHKPPKFEEDKVNKARKYFSDKTSNIEILTDIRHYGGKVNLIDFTRNLYVALFFACNSDINEDGEIIILDANKLPPIEDITYNKDEMAKMGIIEPAKTQTSQSRVMAQDSIFVYFVEGYIGKSYFKEEKIPKELKEDILYFIKKFSNINQEKVYDDLIGFIENEKNYETADTHFYQGKAKDSSGKYKEAIEDYDKAIELYPQSDAAYNNRGLSKHYLGKFKEAIKDYNKAIELNPKSDATYYNRGNAQYSLGENEESIKDYNKAIELNPKFDAAYYNLGVVKSSLGEHEEAIKDYSKAIEINPQYVKAYNNRGNAKSSLGEDEDAIKDYNKAIEIDPQHAKAYYNRGSAKSSLGEHKEEIKDYDKAIKLNPQYADAYYNRGNAKGRLGDKTGAEADLEKVKELEKSKPDA